MTVVGSGGGILGKRPQSARTARDDDSVLGLEELLKNQKEMLRLAEEGFLEYRQTSPRNPTIPTIPHPPKLCNVRGRFGLTQGSSTPFDNIRGFAPKVPDPLFVENNNTPIQPAFPMNELYKYLQNMEKNIIDTITSEVRNNLGNSRGDPCCNGSLKECESKEESQNSVTGDTFYGETMRTILEARKITIMGDEEGTVTPPKKTPWDLVRAKVGFRTGEKLFKVLYDMLLSQENQETLSECIAMSACDLCNAQEAIFNPPSKLDAVKGLSRCNLDLQSAPQILSESEITDHPLYDPVYDNLPDGSTPKSILIMSLELRGRHFGVLKVKNRMTIRGNNLMETTNVNNNRASTYTASRRPSVHGVSLAGTENALLAERFFKGDILYLGKMLRYACPLLQQCIGRERHRKEALQLAHLMDIISNMSSCSSIPELLKVSEEHIKSLIEAEHCEIINFEGKNRNQISCHSESAVKARCTIRDRKKSSLSIPLLSTSSVVGVLEVTRAQSLFSDFDELLLGGVVKYLAITLENSYVIENLNNSTKRVTAMLEVCKQVAGETLKFEALRTSIMEHARRLVNADRATLYTVDWQRKTLTADLGSRVVTMPVNQGIAGTVALTGESLNIKNAYEDARFNQKVDLKCGYRTQSILTTPVKYDGTVVAVAQLVNKKNPDGTTTHFDTNDELTLDTFGAFAGISLKISEQYKQQIREKARLKTMLDAVVGMAEIDIREDIETFSCNIMHHAKSLLRADRASLFLLDKENGQLCSFLTDQTGGEIRFPLGKGIAGEAARTGRLLNIPDAYKDKRFNTDQDRARGYHTKSMLACPVKNGDEVLAIMQLINKEGGLAFDPEDEETIQYFSALSGMTIRNAQMYKFTEESREELSSVLSALNSTSSMKKPLKRTSSFTVNSTDANKLISEMEAIELTEEESELVTKNTFDIHVYVDTPDGLARCLRLVKLMFDKLELVEHFKIPSPSLSSFLCNIAIRYRQVPYHNVYHAIDVTQTLFNFILLLPSQTLTKLEQAVLLVCGLCHDVDHMGLNNSFHYKAETPLGILSNATSGRSPLEVHHCDVAFAVLQSSASNIFINFERRDETQAYKLLVKAILGTDMTCHAQLVEEFSSLPIVTDQPTRPDSDNNNFLLMLLKAADISNPTKEFEVCRKWAFKVIDEFYMQGDLEVDKIGETTNTLHDRNNGIEMADGQLGFIRFFAKPFFKLVVEKAPQLLFLYERMEANEKQWDALLNKTLHDTRPVTDVLLTVKDEVQEVQEVEDAT